MEDWGAVRGRLEDFLRVRGGTIPAHSEADIRVALERVEDRQDMVDAQRGRLMELQAEVDALRQRVEEEWQNKEAYFKAGREAEVEVAALRQRVEEQQKLLDAKWGHEITGAIVADNAVSLRQRVEELERDRDEAGRVAAASIRSLVDDALTLQKRAEAAEAAHRDAAAQWQDEARLRREAEAKLPQFEIQARCDSDEIRRLRAGFMSIEAKLAEATIKVERLRKALTEMVDRFESADDDPPYVVRARAALRGGGESPQPEPEQPATSKHNPAWRALGVGQPPSEEHSKHPTGDYCVYCLSQWPCEESGVE